LLESSIKIRDLISAASRFGMKAVALTDKYVMNGAVEFYNEAASKNIKPIIGCEICIEHNGRLSHLTLLVKDEKGYENLCQIVSKSHLESAQPCSDDSRTGNGYKSNIIPMVKISDLKNMAMGLICMSGCSKGEIPYLLKTKNTGEAYAVADRFCELFEGDFYIEIQRYGSSGSSSCKNLASENLINFARHANIPIVATNNVHYISKEDYIAYKSLARLKIMGTKNDPTMKILENDEHRLKSAYEMERIFRDVPEAIINTQRIADRCDFSFNLGKINIPYFITPTSESQESYLEKLCREGLALRYESSPPEQVLERLNTELGVIKKTGFAGYFLIVADIARFACENEIPICGKGSAAGSLVSYILRISNVDPIQNNLCFERFLNDGRKELPDIDIDISNKDRDKVMKYLCSKYGSRNVARVCSFSTTKPRASIREAGRILSLGKDEVDHIIKAVPNYNRFFTQEDLQKKAEDSGFIDTKNGQYRKIITVSKNIGGYVRHISMHPSAFIVSNSDFAKRIPLTVSETGETMSQYDMSSIEDLGILKIDLINSLSLSLLSESVELLKNKRNIRLDLSKTSYDDKDVYKLMQAGNTLGVFQLESFGIRTLARKVKPSNLNDITLLISLYRPGPQQSGMVANFIERKFGREKTTYIHEDLEPILRETYGIILYQEQVMQVAMKIAGYSLSEADDLRKTMTGLSKDEMQAHQSRFIKGAVAKGYDIYMVKEIFKLISKFASYGFVKAHASAYAELSYKTCYLKAHFPAEFLSIILTNNSGYYNKMQYIEEARRLGIDLKLPDINRSGFDFTVEDSGHSIRAPLTSVRDLGYAGATSLLNEREKDGEFKDFFDFYTRTSTNCKLTKNAVENLIKIGAFDFTNLPRKQLLLAFYCLKNLKRYKPHRLHRHPEYSELTIDNTLKGPETAAQLPNLTDFDLGEKLEMEEKILGFCISANPIQYIKSKLKYRGFSIVRSKFFSRYRFAQYNQNVCTAGFVINRRTEKTRDGNKMLFCTMEDEDGMYETVFFPDSYRKNARAVMNQPLIIIKGRLHFRDNNISVIAREAINISSVMSGISADVNTIINTGTNTSPGTNTDTNIKASSDPLSSLSSLAEMENLWKTAN
jgi:DNA polymerase-3 subunit alpha